MSTPSEEALPREKAGSEADFASDADGFAVLAAHLDSIAERADSDHWRGWTEEDTRAVLVAAREIEGIRAAVAEGMRQAFDIGREYGHREELLERLNWEIEELSGRMARQAWGRGPGREDRDQGRPDGAADA